MSTPETHALLSPSSAARWLACTPSARLEAEKPDTQSSAAEEGTLAHAIGELYAEYYAGLKSKEEFSLLLAGYQSHKLYQAEMLTYCEEYAVYLMERFNEARKNTKDAIIEMERKVDLTAYAPESYGTVDNTIIADGCLEITDLKYGKGVEVSAIENEQLMLYALGSLEKYDLVYDIDRVRMNIYQPRINNFSSYELTVEALRAWGETIKPQAKAAFEGRGPQVPGAHCQFCKVTATCRALAEENLQLAKEEFALSAELSDKEIEEILPKLGNLQKWAKAVQDYAFRRALEEGHKWEGWKLVAGRSTRSFADEKKVVSALRKEGFKPSEMYEKKLKGITAMEKTVGKQVMSDLELQKLIVKPEGKPTLVPERDKRPEIQSHQAAVDDFGKEEELV